MSLWEAIGKGLGLHWSGVLMWEVWPSGHAVHGVTMPGDTLGYATARSAD